MSCLDLNTNGISKYEKAGKYMCIAQVFFYGRNQTVNKTASIKIDNKQDQPFCIQDTTSQHSILGSNIIIAMKFYSMPTYSALSLRKNNRELELGEDNVTIKNISLEIYNVTIMVSGYEIIINITEFNEDDIGNYTVNITNDFGFCDCTVQLLSQELLLLKRFLGIGYFILPFFLLVVTVFCNISIHLYCKKVKKVTLETDENEISREGIEMREADHGYHTINEDNFRIEDTGTENQSEIPSSARMLDIAEVPFLVAASDSNEQQIEEDEYLHPYCTVMQSTVELHEYKDMVPGIVERDGFDIVLNQELERLYENQNEELRQYINNRLIFQANL
ncbi:Hypothetical predicted protein [Mytilus galloprovincialis]|uniref:Immunoglobulin I-set domain-containing protein n=1 Tax=Mytilus galloprovincialis TaxID=29158 RepID=A0A8B6FNB3_MYTGA|nr:Hypothetical predicted protein [Mytilus galloprovincialis]